MALAIKNVLKDSKSFFAEIKENDKIISINGNTIDNVIDFQFFSQDTPFEVVFEGEEGLKKVMVKEEEDLGIVPAEHRCRICNNKCIFCFIDQNPKNLRKSIYLKDDDFVFSFFYGNFITLTNLSKNQIKRVANQKLSPLYISVHTTNPEIHKKMFRYKNDNFDILEILKYFSSSGIEFHLQIVVVPGFNDKDELSKTLNNLLCKELKTISVGIVPVGLTKYRKSLPKIRRVSRTDAIDILKRVRGKKKVFCADEIFLKAGSDIPKTEYYDSFPQLENGIGMIRKSMENWKTCKYDFISEVDKLNGGIIFATSLLAFEFICSIAKEINSELKKDTIKVIKIVNNFFGETVGVSGLLSGADIIQQVGLDAERLALPSNIFNHQGLTLDGKRAKDIKKILSLKKIIIVNIYFKDWRIL